MNKLDELAANLSAEIIGLLHYWIKVDQAKDIQFHEYRMKLLNPIGNSGLTVTERLLALVGSSNSRFIFEVREVVSDKMLGETTSRYIFAKIIGYLNAEYLRMLDKEMEMTESENDLLINRTNKLSERLGLH